MGEDVKRLRELLAKSHARPWHVYNQAVDEGPDYRCTIVSPDETADWVAREVELPDAELIVAAVNNLPALLDVVEAAQHISEFAVHGQVLTPGDIQDLTDALDRLEHSDAQ
jgi:hypothetical protein